MARDTRLTAVFAIRDQLSPVLKTMTGKFEAFKKVVESSTFKEFDKNFGRFRRNLTNAGREVSSLASSMAAPLAGVAASVGMSLTSIATKFMEMGDAVDKASIRVGISAEELQKIQYAAKMSGASAESLNSGLMKLNTNLAAAASGKNADLADLMNRLGISMKDARGNVRSVADVLPELADAFARNENPAIRARMAMAAFGEVGINMIPMLEGGSAGLKQMTDRATSLGFVMSNEDVKASAALGDALSEVTMSVDALSNAMGAKMAPALKAVFERIVALISANREAFSEKFANLANSFAKTLETIDFEGLVNGLLTVADLALRSFNAVGGFSTVVTGLAVVLGGKAVMSVVSLVGTLISLGKSFSALMVSAKALGAVMSGAFGPVGLIIAAVAAGASLVIANWDSVWPALKDGASSLFDFLSGALDVCYEKFGAVAGSVYDVWKSLFTGDIPGLIDGFDKLIVSVLGLLPGKVGEVCQEIYQGMKDAVGQIGTFIKEFFVNFKWTDLVPNWVTKLFSGSGSEAQPASSVSDNFASMPVGSAGTMTGSMRIGVYGYGGAEPRVESMSSSSNLTIEGDVGVIDRSGDSW